MIRAMGLISGTSMDGIDVAIIETDGETKVVTGPYATYDYDPALRRQIGAVVNDAKRAEHEALADLDAALTDAHAAAAERLLAENKVSPASIAVVGFHGQTILHRPERRFTRQLGDGARFAARIGIDVVDRFRHADVAAGGHGAPFAPLYHAALAHKLAQPLMVLNLGGVGNVTYIDGTTISAFDTGPASALLDDWVLRHTGAPFDAGGKIAASGTIDRDILARLMDNPYFAEKPPKSLDRNDFHERAKIIEHLSVVDGAATLAAFTVESVAAALHHVPTAPRRWLVTGGGRHNETFMRALAERLGVTVEPVEAVGWQGDAIEAQAFAYLAVRSLKALPLSVPGTTGVPRAMTGGVLHKKPRAAA